MTKSVMRQADLVSDPRSTAFSLGFWKGLASLSLSIHLIICVATVAIMPIMKQISNE